MINYRRKYQRFFGYGDQDYAPCEFLCGRPLDDIHHIDSDRNNNAIENLIGDCRTCHRKIHDYELYEDSYVRLVHFKFIKLKGLWTKLEQSQSYN